MKTNYLRYTPVLLVALFASSNASALPYYGGGSPLNYQQYIVDPGDSTKLIANPSTTPPIPLESLTTILAGNAAAPGGNTELCTTCDSGFPGTGATTLTIGLASGDLVLSSLTLADWTQALLDQYVGDLINTYSPGSDLAAAKAAFLIYGGPQRSSDPNISYAYEDANGTVRIGLAGFLDASNAPGLGAIIPAGAQVSEIVKATWQGKTNYLYSMGPGSATPSGVATADGSYNGNYEVKIPEPTELALLVVGLTGLLGLRRKVVKA